MSFLRAMRLSEPNFGKMAVLDNDLGWQPMPTVEDMERLCSDVAVLKSGSTSRLAEGRYPVRW